MLRPRSRSRPPPAVKARTSGCRGRRHPIEKHRLFTAAHSTAVDASRSATQRTRTPAFGGRAGCRFLATYRTRDNPVFRCSKMPRPLSPLAGRALPLKAPRFLRPAGSASLVCPEVLFQRCEHSNVRCKKSTSARTVAARPALGARLGRGHSCTPQSPGRERA